MNAGLNPDVLTTIEHLELDDSTAFLTRFEHDVYATRSQMPIADYTSTLRFLRKEALSIRTYREEIDFAKLFNCRLNELSLRQGLHRDHFSIDTGGDPLLVRELGGEHLISPTHFENGAYFSHPHADHQLTLSAEHLPRINIGRYVRFGRNASVNAGGDVTIGNGVWLSPGSQLLRQDHDAYGRPSIGARTVAMTKLPPIVLADYAWVGREAMIGWGADYIGKCSVVATRAFNNTWVGDYSIAGDRGKILQYMPFKAYQIEHLGTPFESLLKIADWEAVNSEWLIKYRTSIEPQIKDHAYDVLSPYATGNVLVLEANNPDGFSSFGKHPVDIINRDRQACASILQWAVDNKKYNIRFRGDLSDNKLPFSDAGLGHYLRKSGYSLVICNSPSQDVSLQLIMEMLRITLPDSVVAVRSDALSRLNGEGERLLKPDIIGDAKINNEIFTLLRKSGGV